MEDDPAAACGLLQEIVRAFDPDFVLSYPAVMDIVAASVQCPDEVDVALSVLITTLEEQALRDGDERNITQDYLKALTILTELVHDGVVFAKLRGRQNLRRILGRLQSYRNGDLGSETDANIRMFACQLAKTFAETSEAIISCDKNASKVYAASSFADTAEGCRRACHRGLFAGRSNMHDGLLLNERRFSSRFWQLFERDVAGPCPKIATGHLAQVPPGFLAFL